MPIVESGLYYPNNMAHIMILAIKETIGPEATQVLFNLADIPPTYQSPPNNFAKAFDFAYFGAILAAFEKMYGARGERALGLRAGRLCFHQGLKEYGTLLNAQAIIFKPISLKLKLRIGLKALAHTFSQFSDQPTTITEDDDRFIYTIQKCPVCWGRYSTIPICYVAIGQIEEGLRWTSDGESFKVEEVSCHAKGDSYCIFHIYKEPL